MLLFFVFNLQTMWWVLAGGSASFLRVRPTDTRPVRFVTGSTGDGVVSHFYLVLYIPPAHQKSEIYCDQCPTLSWGSLEDASGQHELLHNFV